MLKFFRFLFEKQHCREKGKNRRGRPPPTLRMVLMARTGPGWSQEQGTSGHSIPSTLDVLHCSPTCIVRELTRSWNRWKLLHPLGCWHCRWWFNPSHHRASPWGFPSISFLPQANPAIKYQHKRRHKRASDKQFALEWGLWLDPNRTTWNLSLLLPADISALLWTQIVVFIILVSANPRTKPNFSFYSCRGKMLILSCALCNSWSSSESLCAASLSFLSGKLHRFV